MSNLKKTHGKNSLPELKAIKGPFTRPTGPADPQPAFFTKEPEMTQPKKNYHRYTDINNQKHKKAVEPEAVFKVGDMVKIKTNDKTSWEGYTGLLVEITPASKDVKHHYKVDVWKSGTHAWFSKHELTVIPSVKAKPKYRFLKNNEIVRKGDQVYFPETRGWGKANRTIGWRVEDANYSASLAGAAARRFRRKVS